MCHRTLLLTKRFVGCTASAPVRGFLIADFAPVCLLLQALLPNLGAGLGVSWGLSWRKRHVVSCDRLPPVFLRVAQLPILLSPEFCVFAGSTASCFVKLVGLLDFIWLYLIGAI